MLYFSPLTPALFLTTSVMGWICIRDGYASIIFDCLKIVRGKVLSRLFPTTLSPNPTLPQFDLPFLTQSISSQIPWLESILHESGEILLRGFPIYIASDFNNVVKIFSFDELPYVGGAAPRTNVVGRVFTANESPPDQKIMFHHEMAQVPEFSSRLFFFCEVKHRSGGQNSIVLSHVVYERMKQRYPNFLERLEEHGLIYTWVLGEDDDPSSPIGRGWKLTRRSRFAATRPNFSFNIGELDLMMNS